MWSIKKNTIGWVVLILGGIFPPVHAHSLTQAINLALSNNPEVLSAQHKIGIASDQLNQSKGKWLPTVDLTYDIGHEDKKKSGSDPTGLIKKMSSITVNQPLYDGGATRAEVARSDQMEQISIITFDEVRTSVMLKAIESWFELYRLQRVIKMTEMNVAEHRKLFEQVQEKVAAGGAGDAELVRTKTGWIDSRNALIKARGDYQDALATYASVVGIKPEGALSSGLVIRDEELPPTLNDAVELLLDHSYLLHTAHANIRAAQADYDGSRAGLLPTLDFELKSGKKENDAGIEGSDINTTALLKLNYNLYRGGADESRRRETARAVLESQEQLTLTRRKMVEQLSQYWNGLQLTRSLLETSYQKLKLAGKNLSSVQEQFKLGEGDVNAIMAASDAQFMAKKMVLNDEIELHLGRYRLLAHIGLLLERMDAEDVTLVMEKVEEFNHPEDHLSWIDQIIVDAKEQAQLLRGDERSLSESENLADTEVAQEEVVENKAAGAETDLAAAERALANEKPKGWDSAYNQMKDAGWVVFNAADQVVLASRAPEIPESEKKEGVTTRMALVGGAGSLNSAALQQHRAQKRRDELSQRLGAYTQRSYGYQNNLQEKKIRLNAVKQALEYQKRRYWR